MESTEDYSDDQDFECGSYDETIFAEKDSIKENDQGISLSENKINELRYPD